MSEERETIPDAWAAETAQDPFDLVEEMRFDPADGLADLNGHLERLADKAAALDFAFNRHDARNALQAATFRLQSPRRVILRLARGGAMAIEAGPLTPPPSQGQ